MVLSGVRACVFDAYGTLFDVNAAAERCRDALGPNAEALSTLWRAKQVQYTWLRSLMGRHADFRQVTREALGQAMASLGLADQALADRLMDCYARLDAYPDAAPALAAVRRAGLASAILSNGSPDMLAAAVESAGLAPALDAVLSVEAVGIYKPHPRVYALATERLGVDAGQVCFVSSNGWDAHGAAAFGFQVVWVNRARQVREALPGRIAAEIASLAELPALLGTGT